MKFFLDTANLDELKQGAAWGIIDGVTTNPSLIAKERVPVREQIRRICGIVDGDVSADVISTDAANMIHEGRELARIQALLAASLRTANHVVDTALAKVHVATAALRVFDALFNHPLTDKGLERFLKDHRAAFAEVPVAV